MSEQKTRIQIIEPLKRMIKVEASKQGISMIDWQRNLLRYSKPLEEFKKAFKNDKIDFP
jgi:hypothetical protein